MGKSNLLISLAMFMSLGLAACSTESKQTSDNRSSNGTPATDKPVAADKGRLSLKMPKQDKVPYQKLEISLDSFSDCGYADGGDPEPYPIDDVEPQPEPAILEVEEKEETRDVSAKKDLALHARHSKNYEEYSECGSVTSYSQTFEYSEDAVVSIDDIIPGSYSIHVRLLDKSGSASEEGYGYADVAPGVVTSAVVEIYPTQGNGRLDIQIIRGGDRIGYGDDGLCSPSAYVDENGEVQYGDADCKRPEPREWECGTDGGDVDPSTPVSNDATTAEAKKK